MLGKAHKQGRRLRWRDYRTASGGRPVKDFIAELADEDAAAVIAAMREVTVVGLEAARQLRGEISAETSSRDQRVRRARGADFGPT
jgi:hypothetical protein